MADTPLRKFMFDKSFDDAVDTPSAKASERKPVTLKPEQIDALKKEAWDVGFAAGQKTNSDDQAQQLKIALSHLEDRIGHLMENLQVVYQAQEEQLRKAILAIARKILPDFTSQYGLQEITSLLDSAIGDMLHEPRLVVRIHEHQFDIINGKIQEITAQKAYAGKVVVLADPDVAVGNCRIEWADGGVERNTEATWQAIENVVAPAQNPNSTSSQE